MIQRMLAGLLSLLLITPMALLLLLSFSRHWIFPDLLPAQWQLRQWSELLHGNSELARATLRSLAMATGVALSSTALALPTSRGVARHRRRGTLLTLAYLPFAVSPVVLGASLLYVFLRLHLAGGTGGVMLGQFVFAYAYAVILLTSLWNPEAESLAGLATTLGASPAQLWWRVLVPRALPLLAVCLFQTFLISWFDYALELLIGSGLVDTLTIRLFQYFSAGDTRLAATCALLLMAPPLLGLVLNQRLLSAGLLFRGLEHDD
ncbi:MAG: ABC transporter permease subunit [Gammaproteobacteria bacterium]|nr:ABC transporter permease subunit [Gammaproteobacteria bacterium]